MRTCLRFIVAALAFASLVEADFAMVDVAGIDRERILRGASNALTLPPITITAFPARDRVGSTNDYYSNGDYWWPNPHTATGLPYIRRDGEANPNNFNKHRECLRQLSEAVAVLGAAYKLTGDDHHAEKAAQLLRVFFLDPATRMNPNLEHAQAIPGVSQGRGAGIIDTLHLIEIPPAIEIMNRSRAFSPEVSNGMKSWFGEYVHWMLTSKNGREEAGAVNNHAVAFWLQVAVFCRFTGDAAVLADCRRHYKEVFVPKQMATDGSFPAELKRTKPYGYSIFQLDNMATLCQVLSTPQDNLWKFELPDGRGIRKAVAYLHPFLEDKSKWPLKPDVEAWEGWPVRQPSLLFAGIAFEEPAYIELWKKLPAEPASAEVRRNVAITQPLLWLEAADDKTSAPEIRTPTTPRSP